MNIHETHQQFYRDLIAEKARVNVTDTVVSRTESSYNQFLSQNLIEKIVFEADFVDGRFPLAVSVPANATLFELDYDQIQSDLDKVFADNKIAREREELIGGGISMWKMPDYTTENLRNFAVAFPNVELEVEKRLELLQGKGNFLHCLIKERYIDFYQRFSKMPLAEIWTVKRLSASKKPFVNTETALVLHRSELSKRLSSS